MITNKMKVVQLKMREARFWPAPQQQRKDKKFQFALKIGWRARVLVPRSSKSEVGEGEPNFAFTNWRGGRDSNPRPPP